MEKSCLEHGDFSVIIWRDKVSYEDWRGELPAIGENENKKCPNGCGVCDEHAQGICCVLLEITRKCNLKCNYCFADADGGEFTLNELKSAVDTIMSREDKPLLQFSGGEPTTRDDLPELVAYAHETGCRYTQLNSNGLRLAEDEEYVKALAGAGLSFVFMQFDGVDDGVYKALRNAPLYERKLRAVEMCDKYNIGVTLVPTIVRGINDSQIGDIIRFGASLSPAVRGVHFQPVSYFGRYPQMPGDEGRYTLDELLYAIHEQAGIELSSLLPSRCDHPLCGCHGSFVARGKNLRPITSSRIGEKGVITTAERNREYVGSRWKREAEPDSCCCGNADSLDDFLRAFRRNGFTITAMAFQDAMNLDIERLRRCSLHVYDGGVLKPFCARYITPVAAR
jgi:uncharacterized radical SAM superfamily Fe-S cluster-containing enzyme